MKDKLPVRTIVYPDTRGDQSQGTLSWIGEPDVISGPIEALLSKGRACLS